MTTASQTQTTAEAPQQTAPVEKPAETKVAPTEDFRAKYEAAADAAKSAQATLSKMEKDHKALLKSIEDGSLITKVLSEKLGTKQDEDPAKVLESVKADREKHAAEVQRLRNRVRQHAITSALREVAGDAWKPERISAFIALDDVEVTEDGEVASLATIKERVAKLRETDAYLFRTKADSDATRAAPLPSSAAPPPANPEATPSKKPEPRRVGGLMSLAHLRR